MPETITLEEGDCAVVFRADGGEEVYSPDVPEEERGEVASEGAHKTLLCVTMLHTPTLLDATIAHVESLLDLDA